MTREELTLTIQTRKRAEKLTWKQIASAIGAASPILTTAALLGQMRLTDDEAAKVVELLGLGDEERSLLTEVPYRGSLAAGPPTDPLIYSGRVRRRHHECDRLRHADGTAARPERRPREDHDVREISPLQTILGKAYKQEQNLRLPASQKADAEDEGAERHDNRAEVR